MKAQNRLYVGQIRLKMFGAYNYFKYRFVDFVLVRAGQRN